MTDDHRRFRHFHDRGRDYDRSNYSKPRDRPFSTRNYDHRQHDNNRKPIHTVFLFNIDFQTTQDQIQDFAKEFGEIQLFYQPPSKKGMAFITYYDIRDAINMVDNGFGRSLNGKEIKTAYAYQPPKYSKRDPRDICSSTTFELLSKSSQLTIDDVKSAAEKFGEIRSLVDIGKGRFDVVYFDLRSAKEAVEQKTIEINGEKVMINYNLTEGIGEEPVLIDKDQKKERYKDSENADKKHQNPPVSLPPPFSYPYPYPFPYPYPYQFPNFPGFPYPNISHPNAPPIPFPPFLPPPPIQPQNGSSNSSYHSSSDQTYGLNNQQSVPHPLFDNMMKNPFNDDSTH